MRRAAYRLTYKFVDETKLDPLHIAIEGRRLSYFWLSTNPIISFYNDGTLYYFRECPRLLSRDAFIGERIDRFFATLDRIGIPREHFAEEIPIRLDFSPTEVAEFSEYIRKKQSARGFYPAMARADATAERRGFSIWGNTSRADAALFSAFGLGDIPRGLYDIGVYFLWCMRSAALTLRTLRAAHGQEHSFFSAVRNMASARLAALMGMEHLIAGARWCVLDVAGEGSMLGLLCDAAPGNRMSDVSITPDGSLQRELTDLNLLDAAAFQTDHGPNNYNVCESGGGFSVCAFDNDNPAAFFPYCGTGRTLSACAPFTDRQGMIARPHLSAKTAERLDAVDANALRESLSPYLNRLQVAATAKRIAGLQRAVRKTASKKKDLLISDGEWDRHTVCEETCGSYGETYLTRAAKINQRSK